MAEEMNMTRSIGQSAGAGRPRLGGMLRTPVAIGALAIAGFFGGFGTWALTAPLSGAAVAGGVVSPDTNSKSIQHLEGGIVRSIEVRDGSVVAVGDVLVVLDDTKARSALEQQLVEHRSLIARRARLDAEWRYLHGEDDARPEFPAELRREAETVAAVAEIVEAEERQFATRKATLESNLAIMDQTVRQYEAEVRGLNIQVEAIGRALTLIKQEIDLVDDLRSRGLEKISRVLDVQQSLAEREEKKASLESQITTRTELVKTTTLQIAQAKATRLDEVISELVSVRGQIQSVAEKIAASRDTLERTVVRSPVEGTILNLRLHTIGGVIEPGATVMDIVPAEDELIIDARVQPNDIDAVHAGQTARLQLLAYPTREMPLIEGTVETVSASSLVDSATGESYYLVKIKVPPSELDDLGPRIRMVPGMSVQALIVTRERTFVDYLIDPILKSAQKSFRES